MMLRSTRPADPGEIRVDLLPPQLRARLGNLGVNQTTVIAAMDGVAALIVCAKRTETVGIPPREQVAAILLRDRQDLLSRQILRELRRRAAIDVRS